jgi:eukaryotic-like serine/threonine-protein kinase
MSPVMGDLDTRQDPRAGVRLANRYTIDERLSSGGMATVYRATDEILGRAVAVKIMHPALAADPSFVERFRREGQNVARLSHPNVATVYDYGEAPIGNLAPDLFMVMELVEGTTLRSLLERFGRLDPPMARHVARGVAAALDHAHNKGIVHRDVKPENVLLTPDGQVKVVDFGIAKALGPQAVNLTTDRPIGTVAYVAPEQLTMADVGTRADVYALGAMTYEMVTGRPPFHGDTPHAVAAARLAQPTLVAGVSEQIDAAIAKATSADPDDRFSTPGDFARALGDLGEPAFLLATDHLPDASMVAQLAAPVVAAPRRDPVEVLPFQARLHRSKRRRFRIVALVALVLAVAAVAVYAVVPKPTAVPDLRGDSLDEAKSALTRGGLIAGDINHQFHDVAAEGTVFGTDPDPGTAVKKGVRIDLLVSKGPQLFAVPDIVGKPFDDAKAMMSAAYFSLSLGSRKHHDTIPKEAVISYGPPREEAKRATAFTATVSDGPELVAVPDVDGKSSSAAEKAIEAAGFTFGTSSDYSESVPEGVVIRTDPAGGATAPKGSQITAIVSKGPRPFAMPDLVGLRLGAAKDKVRAAGLMVRNEYPVPGSGKEKNTVQGQNPVHGTMVRKGTPVDIYYAN